MPRSGCRFAGELDVELGNTGPDGVAAGTEPALVTGFCQRHADRQPALPYPGCRG